MVDIPSIVFVNRVFPPERGATGRCLWDLAGRLAARGWRVSVVADGDRRSPERQPAGVAVHRTGAAVPPDDRPDARAYLESLRRLVGRTLRLPRHDVVVTLTDPPLLALAGPLLAAGHRAAALHWCHDLYPDLLPVLGVPMPVPLRRLARAGMARALRRHDGVVAIGGCMRERLAALGVPEERLTVLPNWPDPVIRPLVHSGNRYRRSLGVEGSGRFLVVYSGMLGLAHPMAGVLDAAARLQDSDPAVLFLLIGEGRGFAAVEDGARARGLRNLRRLPWQPASRLAESLSAADLHLVSMATDAKGLLVPSKLAGVQAAGRPCLFLGPPGSEGAERVEGCGLVLDPLDGAAIAAAVRAYAADPARRIAEGERAARRASDWTAERAAAAFSALAGARLAARRAGDMAVGWRVPHA